jgi:hypothetical protein
MHKNPRTNRLAFSNIPRISTISYTHSHAYLHGVRGLDRQQLGAKLEAALRVRRIRVLEVEPRHRLGLLRLPVIVEHHASLCGVLDGRMSETTVGKNKGVEINMAKNKGVETNIFQQCLGKKQKVSLIFDPKHFLVRVQTDRQLQIFHRFSLRLFAIASDPPVPACATPVGRPVADPNTPRRSHRPPRECPCPTLGS